MVKGVNVRMTEYCAIASRGWEAKKGYTVVEESDEAGDVEQ